MTYTCDICQTALNPEYMPQVDARGRPCLAICEPCNSAMVRERAQRLGLPVVDLIDVFENVLRRERILKESVH